MKSKNLEFDLTPDEFYRALAAAVQKIERESPVVLHWFNKDKSVLPSRLEITTAIIPLKKVIIRRGMVNFKSMETMSLGKQEFYYGIKGLEANGFFGLRYESEDSTTIFVDADDGYQSMFEKVFNGACRRLVRPGAGGATEGAAPTDIPPEPGINTSREDWFNCYHERKRIGKETFTHRYMARKIGLSESKTRQYYALWHVEKFGESASKKCCGNARSK